MLDSSYSKKKKKQVDTTAHDMTGELINVKKPEKKVLWDTEFSSCFGDKSLFLRVTSDFKLLDLKNVSGDMRTNGAEGDKEKADGSTTDLDPFACDFNDTLSVVRTL